MNGLTQNKSRVKIASAIGFISLLTSLCLNRASLSMGFEYIVSKCVDIESKMNLSMFTKLLWQIKHFGWFGAGMEKQEIVYKFIEKMEFVEM